MCGAFIKEPKMARSNNHGSVLVFVTLAITLLLIMVGMGLDTGMLSYVRSQAQPAVDAAALAAVSGLISGQAEVESRVAWDPPILPLFFTTDLRSNSPHPTAQLMGCESDWKRPEAILIRQIRRARSLHRFF
jgi:Putative Flp pilus-assembly TadE/G-like